VRGSGAMQGGRLVPRAMAEDGQEISESATDPRELAVLSEVEELHQIRERQNKRLEGQANG